MIQEMRSHSMSGFTPRAYARLLANLENRCGGPIQFPGGGDTDLPVAMAQLDEIAEQGAALALTSSPARNILLRRAARFPPGFEIANETAHPHFLTADFAWCVPVPVKLVPQARRDSGLSVGFRLPGRTMLRLSRSVRFASGAGHLSWRAQREVLLGSASAHHHGRSQPGKRRPDRS